MIPVNVFLTAVILSHWNPSFPPLSNFTPADIESHEESLSLFDSAAQEMDVPTEITQAIARVESNGTPYALNVEGKGYFFDSKEEALAAAAKAQSLSAAGRVEPQVGRQDDHGVAEVHLPAEGIGEAPFLEDLQQHVHDVGMAFSTSSKSTTL